MQDKISVIIPIYNVENYLRRCVDSVLNQTYKNIEIILVDDGSSDNSGKICNGYEKKDKRIKVVHKKNGGLSEARNHGLKIATGHYIGFVDADDFIETDMYEILLNKLLTHDADIVECRYKVIGGKKNNFAYDSEIVHIFNTKSALKELILSRRLKTTVCNKLYKKEIIENIIFPLNKFNEDVSWTYKVFANSEKIISIDISKYNYFNRQDSIRASLKYLSKIDWFYAFKERLEFIDRNYNSILNLAQKLFFIHIIKEYRKIQLNNYLDRDKKNRRFMRDYIKKNYKTLLRNPLFGHKSKTLMRIFRIMPAFGCKIPHLYKNTMKMKNLVMKQISNLFF